MRLIKIGIGNVNPAVGAVRSNVDRVLAQARAMAADGVTVACFTEQVVGGYPPEDLIQWRAFVAAQRAELERFAAATAALPIVSVLGTAAAVGGQLFNCAAVVHGGAILGLVPKEKLPTYNVFYEARTFARGTAGLALEAGGIPLGDYLFAFAFGLVSVEVCEDVWSPDGPMRRRCYSGAEMVLNVTSSPFRVGVPATRREMLATRSADNEVTLVYANTVGAQDGLIFDGGGFVFQNGRPVLEAPRFRQGWMACVVDLDRTLRSRQENTTWRLDCEAFQRQEIPVPVLRSPAPTADGSRLPYPAPAWQNLFLPAAGAPERTLREATLDDLVEALALGVADYFRKSGAFRSLGVALSGGRDSMLSLLLAWRAAQLLAADGIEAGIQAFYMPSRYSGEETRDAAHTLCRELSIPLRVVAIEEAFDREVEATREMLGGEEPTEVTRQNVQARVRAGRMWNWANSSGALFLQTGDMSEKAVGYTTVGGDLEGALSVIANVPKTVVVALLERFHERFGFAGVRRTLDTEPGPELAAAQTAEDELMPFPVLDACLYLYAGEKLAPAEVGEALRSLFPEIAAGRLAEWARRFATLFTRSIYKWVQSPLALHVGSLDLDRERALQLPVVQRNEWNNGPV
ncbi:MAG TPA: NAD(+) synthase [Thermoanaerobaculia bacterium]|nr:NAD(+) synthase [Thermoanaerobaculia bacterium]